ncbi:MAG: PD40 domain-containing protein [Anaerolineales bacterium]|nr:PD40 domain-containing protein [Anaerolineales bacterium]
MVSQSDSSLGLNSYISKKSGQRLVVAGCLSILFICVFVGILLTHKPKIPDDAILFVSNYGNLAGRGIFVMNSDGSNITQLSNIPSQDNSFEKLWSSLPQWIPKKSLHFVYLYDPIWSPDGAKISFLMKTAGSSNYEIYFMDVSTRQIAQVTNNDIYEASTAWSPDGQYIVFLAADVDFDPNLGTLSDIVILNTSDYSTTTIVSRLPVNNPTWSPDNKKIVYQADNMDYSLYSIEVDSRKITPLTDVSVIGPPDWSPNDTAILFVCELGSLNLEVCKVDEDGSNFTQLTNTPYNSIIYEAIWSPDGSKIAFIESVDISVLYNNQDLVRMIYVMNADGSGLIQLTQPTIYYSSLSWAPDGKSIVFLGDMSGDLSLYAINIDGTGLRQLTDFVASQPSWRP